MRGLTRKNHKKSIIKLQIVGLQWTDTLCCRKCTILLNNYSIFQRPKDTIICLKRWNIYSWNRSREYFLQISLIHKKYTSSVLLSFSRPRNSQGKCGPELDFLPQCQSHPRRVSRAWIARPLSCRTQRPRDNKFMENWDVVVWDCLLGFTVPHRVPCWSCCQKKELDFEISDESRQKWLFFGVYKQSLSDRAIKKRRRAWVAKKCIRP